MTDDEAATLCEAAYQALLCLPEQWRTYPAQRCIRDEIARLRHRTPEDIQNEFEGKGK